MSVLSAALLGGLLATPIATIGLFTHGVSDGRHDKWWRQAGRFILAIAWTAVLVSGVAGLLLVLDVSPSRVVVATATMFGAGLLWLPFTRRWGARAHVCWAVTTYLFAVYLVFMLVWTFLSHLGAAATVGAMILWLLELFAAGLGCAYLWELCDTLGRATWRRRLTSKDLARRSEGQDPFVSLQVPCYNEPPEMVIETLESLRALDYSNYEIVAIDDNTDDEGLWRPVEAWCGANRVKFVHLTDWPGYKSGALNYALQHVMDPRTEVIGVVDSDYQIDSAFLRECAPLFTIPKVGFIQAPQDYRDWEGACFYRRLYFSYRYFFAVSQRSRNERNAAIFAGTMGLIRRDALEEVGGWNEWCITEDAELSLRLLRNGWSGIEVDPSFGKGIMPLTFEALKGQRFRWCFGGIQILRMHWRDLMPRRRHSGNQLDLGQRWAYLSGGIQWYGDLLALLFFAFLLVGATNITFGGGLLFRKLTGFLVAAIPFLVVLGLLRAVALLRQSTGASWREALGAFLIWQSTSLTVARASVQALFAKEAVFLRTPKTVGERRFADAVRANWSECLFGGLGLAAIAGALWRHTGYADILIAGLLVWPTVSFLAAPYNSVSAQRAALPPQLAARRRTEHLRYGARHLSFAVGGLGLVGGVAVLVAALLGPGPHTFSPPQIIGPAQGQPVHIGSDPGASTSTTTTTGPGNSASTTVTSPTTSAPTSSTAVTTTTSPSSSTTTSEPRSTSTTTSVPSTSLPTTTVPSSTTIP